MTLKMVICKDTALALTFHVVFTDNDFQLINCPYFYLGFNSEMKFVFKKK